MARHEFPLLLMGLLTICYFWFNIISVDGFIAINWGRQASHRLIPSMVVDLLLQNNIRDLKLFSPADNVLKAFAGGDVAITITLPNEGLERVTTLEKANEWMEKRIDTYQKYNVNIKYLHVGIEPFSLLFRNRTFDNAVDVFRLVQQVLVQKYGDKIKASTPHFTDVLIPNITKPSDAEFRPDLTEKMNIFVRLLRSHNSPFVMNIFPIHYVAQNNWDIEFSFIENRSNFSVYDEKTKLVYRNAFEFAYDSFLTAIAKAGAPDLTLMVGQIGWPTDGYPGANTSNAERFYRELLPYLKSKKGTPLRPGVSIDVYLHSLVDENMNWITYGSFQRHWGVYRSNGEPKYKIDFTGNGQDIYPTTAKGVILMPKRWCVYNGRTNNLKDVNEQFNMACSAADCTALSPGGSCSHLNFNQNVSYAFNRYFQSKAQSSTDACDFKGFGMIVPDDPSDGTCKFQVEILAADYQDNGGLNTNKKGKKSYGTKLHGFSASKLLLMYFGLLVLSIVHVL
ncbi:hypothetical protein BUALT_Bualt11G0008200 [Buddleja alternifolia]|uniref:X8 domain-containing protein n=1 Tax=Buddleja alternifolia TaxID=168488 RepID=A0AAV6WXX0_9LAMI|nr:hypothetical protein BUALT_Bualt11G0008200 [Buddleja alternifolia]